MVFSWHRLHSLCHHILCMAFFPPKQLTIPVGALDVKCLSNVHVFSDFPSLLQATRGEKQHTQCIRLQEQFIVCKQGKHFCQVLPTIQRQPGSLRQTPVPGTSAASPLRTCTGMSGDASPLSPEHGSPAGYHGYTRHVFSSAFKTPVSPVPLSLFVASPGIAPVYLTSVC